CISSIYPEKGNFDGTCPHNGSSYIGMPLSLLPFAGHRVHSVWLFPCHIQPCSVHILFQPVFPLRQYVPCSQWNHTCCWLHSAACLGSLLHPVGLQFQGSTFPCVDSKHA